MKKVLIITGILFSVLTGPGSIAQVSIGVQFGTPVARQSWYANDNDYYYLPEQGVYYNVRRRGYVFQENGSWLFAKNLPSRYGSYSYRSSKYVRVRDRSPFDRDNDYRRRYYRGRSDNNNGYRNDRRNNNDRQYENHDNDANRDHRNDDRRNSGR